MPAGFLGIGWGSSEASLLISLSTELNLVTLHSYQGGWEVLSSYMPRKKNKWALVRYLFLEFSCLFFFGQVRGIDSQFALRKTVFNFPSFDLGLVFGCGWWFVVRVMVVVVFSCNWAQAFWVRLNPFRASLSVGHFPHLWRRLKWCSCAASHISPLFLRCLFSLALRETRLHCTWEKQVNCRFCALLTLSLQKLIARFVTIIYNCVFDFTFKFQILWI